MKKIKPILVIFLVFSVVLVSFPQIEMVKAQEPLNLTIKPDGSVEPSTDLLERNGTTYTFKGDIFGTIMVQKGSITIDGAGHTLQGRKEVDERGVYLVGPDRSHASCRNVLVKNLRICNFWTGIFVVGASNNSIIGNYLENAGIHLIGCANYIGDLIKHNIFRDAGIFVDYNTGGLDVITENNFFNGWIGVGLSVSPIVEKNYWSDYNGTDNNGDGIGDTPYISRYILDEKVQDDYPLIAPLDIEVIPEFPDTTPPTISIISPENKTYTVTDVPLTFTVNESTSWRGYSLDSQTNVTVAGNTTLTELPDGSHSLIVYAKDNAGNTGASEIIYFSIAQQSEPQESEPFPTWIVAAIVIIAVVGAALLVYFRKIRKTTKPKNNIEGVM